MEISQRFAFIDGKEPVELSVKCLESAQNSLPGFVWLGGFRSDMTGTKAQAMVEHADSLGASSLRFDYSGHGQSGGEFIKGTISKWVAQSLAVIRQFTLGPQILVGSSMGGWIALRLVEEFQKLGEEDRIAGLLLIAPAPDFTAELMETRFTGTQRKELDAKGFFLESSDYSSEPNTITRMLIEDGRNNLVFGSGLHVRAPVHILQGMQDPDVPYDHALKLVHELPHDDVVITLVKDGDHRLSRPVDIEIIRRTMTSMAIR